MDGAESERRQGEPLPVGTAGARHCSRPPRGRAATDAATDATAKNHHNRRRHRCHSYRRRPTPVASTRPGEVPGTRDAPSSSEHNGPQRQPRLLPTRTPAHDQRSNRSAGAPVTTRTPPSQKPTGAAPTRAPPPMVDTCVARCPPPSHTTCSPPQNALTGAGWLALTLRFGVLPPFPSLPRRPRLGRGASPLSLSTNAHTRSPPEPPAKVAPPPTAEKEAEEGVPPPLRPQEALPACRQRGGRRLLAQTSRAAQGTPRGGVRHPRQRRGTQVEAPEKEEAQLRVAASAFPPTTADRRSRRRVRSPPRNGPVRGT